MKNSSKCNYLDAFNNLVRFPNCHECPVASGLGNLTVNNPACVKTGKGSRNCEKMKSWNINVGHETMYQLAKNIGFI